MKRFLAVLICIFMLVSLLPAFAFAEESGGEPTPTPTEEPTLTEEPTPTPTQEPTPEPTEPVQEPTPTPMQEPTPTPDTTTTPAPTPETVSITGVTITPAAASVQTGETLQFSAVVNGTGTYDNTVTWNVSGNTISNTKIDVNGLLTVDSAEQGVTLTVTATANGDTTKSASATVSVKYIDPTKSVAITSPTSGQTITVAVGGTATMSISAEGATSYKWHMTSGSGDFGPIEGAENSTLTISNVTTEMNGYQYRCEAYNDCAPATSPVFTLKVVAGYKVTVSAEGKGTATANVSAGITGDEVTLTATPEAGYAFAGWQMVSGGVTIKDNKFTIGTENVVIKAVFLPPDAPTATKLNISYGRLIYGETLEIQVNPTTRMMTRAATFGTLELWVNGSKVASSGIDTLPFTLSIPVTGAYGFKQGANNKIQAVHVGVDGKTVTSSDAECVTVFTPCSPKPPCKPTHYCCGQNHFNGKCVTVRSGEDVTFKVELGCNETCQWYVDKGDGCGFAKIDGATSPRFTIKNVTRKIDGYKYRCIVQNCCDVVSKPIFTLNVASGQLYTPKTGDSSIITIAAGCGALAALMLTGGRRSKRMK